MGEGTVGLPPMGTFPPVGVPADMFPGETEAAMQQGVLQALLATIAVAQRHAQGLLWICGGDAPLVQTNWTDTTELLQLQGDLQLQALLELGAGLSSD